MTVQHALQLGPAHFERAHLVSALRIAADRQTRHGAARTTGATARTATGRRCVARARLARQWDLLGALCVELGVAYPAELPDPLIAALAEALGIATDGLARLHALVHALDDLDGAALSRVAYRARTVLITTRPDMEP
ncbi:MAG: hypothetical protein M0P31_19295 [Solirubrobacteraceae bacterium]|nr:hypothetical protein [Solirubrobacteraceae bacterium]